MTTYPAELPATAALVSKIIDEAVSDDGTWSYAFLRDIEGALLKSNQSNLDELVDGLVKHMFRCECSSLSRFKITQLLGCLKLWKSEMFLSAIQRHAPVIDHYSDLLVGPLSGPTNPLLKKLISAQGNIEKRKAASCPPSQTVRKRFSFT